MTAEIILTVPARHLTTGDHFNGMTVMSIDRFRDRHHSIKFVIPHTTHTMTVIVMEKDLDAVSFPLTKRGDDYSPSRRNAALGLPPAPEKVYAAPEHIAVYPAGTKVGDVKHFDRGQHIHFRCPLHPEAKYSSKDPFVSSWFAAAFHEPHEGCSAGVGDYIVTSEYLPTRNG